MSSQTWKDIWKREDDMQAAIQTLANASQALLLAYANERIKPEHTKYWKAMIDALKAVGPLLEEK